MTRPYSIKSGPDMERSFTQCENGEYSSRNCHIQQRSWCMDTCLKKIPQNTNRSTIFEDGNQVRHSCPLLEAAWSKWPHFVSTGATCEVKSSITLYAFLPNILSFYILNHPFFFSSGFGLDSGQKIWRGRNTRFLNIFSYRLLTDGPRKIVRAHKSLMVVDL